MAFDQNEQIIIQTGRAKGKTPQEIEQKIKEYRNGTLQLAAPRSAPAEALHTVAEGINSVASTVMQPMMQPIQKAASALNTAVLGPQADQQAQALLQKGGEMYQNAVPEVARDALTVGAVAVPAARALTGPLKGAAASLSESMPAVKAPSLPSKAGLAEGLQARATRLSPGVRNEFKAMTGETPEAFQVKYGATGTPDQVVSKLYEQFSKSREAVDAALASAKPTRFKVPAFKDALTALEDKVKATSTDGVPSPIAQQVANLRKVYDTQGLTIAQENAVKRLYEMNVKLDYIKENVPNNVTLAKNVDSQLRNSVEKHADQLGVKGVKEQNKITQATRMLMDEIGKASNGRAANNILGLTDTILAAQVPATPGALALFLGKKTLSSETALGMGARAFAPTPSTTKVVESTKPFNPVAELGGMSSGTKSSRPSKVTSTSTSSKPSPTNQRKKANNK